MYLENDITNGNVSNIDTTIVKFKSAYGDTRQKLRDTTRKETQLTFCQAVAVPTLSEPWCENWVTMQGGVSTILNP